jgi:prepilin-type N-terminal cleavage/methylation domain-containing protein
MFLRPKSGFTMVELLVSSTIMLMVLGAIYTVYRVQTHSTKVEANRLEAQQFANVVVDMMVREIRNTGYFPAGDCTSPTNANGIVSAGKQSLRLVYDSTGTNGCADADEDITYRFDTTGCPSGFGDVKRATAVPAQEQALTDCNVPTATNSFTFTYYPQQTSTSAPAPFCFSTGDPVGCSGTLSANLGNIQRVSISLTVQGRNPDAQFSGVLSATMTSNVDLRNRGSA